MNAAEKSSCVCREIVYYACMEWFFMLCILGGLGLVLREIDRKPDSDLVRQAERLGRCRR